MYLLYCLRYHTSLFNDLSTTSRALRMTKIEALMWIISSNIGSFNIDSSDLQYVMTMIAEHRDDLLDYLTSNLYSGLEWMSFFIHPVCVLTVSNMAKEHILTSVLTPSSELYRHPVDRDLHVKTLTHALNVMKSLQHITIELPSITY